VRPEAELARLVRAHAPMRRAMAALASRLIAHRAWERLGFVRLRDYATERLGVSARSLHDLAHVDKTFAALPRLEAAFVSGEVPWTKARLVARVATAGDEDAWLARAGSMTAAALAHEVRRVDVGALGRAALDDDDGEETAYENIRLRCTPEVQAKWYHARQLAWRVVGHPVRPWECAELVAAEVLSALPMEPAAGDGMAAAVSHPGDAGGGAPADRPIATTAIRSPAARGPDEPDGRAPRSDGTDSGIVAPAGVTGAERGARPLDANGALAGARSAGPARGGCASSFTAACGHAGSAGSDRAWPAGGAGRAGSAGCAGGAGCAGSAGHAGGGGACHAGQSGPVAANEAAALPAGARSLLCLESLLEDLDRAGPFQLDRRLRRAVRLEQRLDAEIGARLVRLAHEHAHLDYGYSSLDAYLREQFGLAPRKVRALLRLERASRISPALAEAYREGRVSWVQAHALVPVLLIGRGRAASDAWIRWAQQVSFRRLQADVEEALLLNTANPARFAETAGLPSAARDEAEPEARAADEGEPAEGAATDRQIGAQFRGSRGNTRPVSNRAERASAVAGGAETARLFIHAPRDVARLVRATLWRARCPSRRARAPALRPRRTDRAPRSRRRRAGGMTAGNGQKNAETGMATVRSSIGVGSAAA
jgi:hypothetical protein